MIFSDKKQLVCINKSMSLAKENSLSHLKDAQEKTTNSQHRFKRSSFRKIDANQLSSLCVDDFRNRKSNEENKKNSTKALNNPPPNSVASKSTNYLTYHSENCKKGASECFLTSSSVGANIRIIPAHIMNKHR